MDGQTLQTSESILCIQVTASNEDHIFASVNSNFVAYCATIGVNSQFVALLPPIQCQ